MVSQARATVVSTLKAAGARPRKGHLRLAVDDLFWYVDPRLEGVGGGDVGARHDASPKVSSG